MNAFHCLSFDRHGFDGHLVAELADDADRAIDEEAAFDAGIRFVLSALERAPVDPDQEGSAPCRLDRAPSLLPAADADRDG